MTQPLVKFCGFTREADVDDAIEVGANFIGFVCYPKSPRFVSPQRIGQLAARLPAHVTPVLLFVNTSAADIHLNLSQAPNAVLQFHGEESLADCQHYGVPFWKVARVPTGPGAAGFDLLQFNQQYRPAQAVLLDAKIDAYGGGGHSFDWTAFPWSHPELNASRRLVLSGGLSPANVTDGIRLARPWAVDVSSGIEQSKGIKDRARMLEFVQAVQSA
ncbi:phosphoribosylanthranilate isomerase [Comamonadaceae bacterium M7527]|nr:phosphoribosylanthranilate isomerase [Comamonadaceae bacterium M7527]